MALDSPYYSSLPEVQGWADEYFLTSGLQQLCSDHQPCINAIKTGKIMGQHGIRPIVFYSIGILFLHSFLHFTSLHSIPVHSSPLHFILLHSTSFLTSPLPPSLHSILFHSTSIHSAKFHCLHLTPLHSTVLCSIPLNLIHSYPFHLQLSSLLSPFFSALSCSINQYPCVE